MSDVFDQYFSTLARGAGVMPLAQHRFVSKHESQAFHWFTGRHFIERLEAPGHVVPESRPPIRRTNLHVESLENRLF